MSKIGGASDMILTTSFEGYSTFLEIHSFYNSLRVGQLQGQSGATFQPGTFRPKTGLLFPCWWKLDKWGNSQLLLLYSFC